MKHNLFTAESRAGGIRSELAADPDWGLATGAVIPLSMTVKHQRDLAVTRLTKKALRALYPNCRCLVRRERGLASKWVVARIFVPDAYAQYRTQPLKPRSFESEFGSFTEEVLLALGIKYATYVPDRGPGLNDPQPCLSISVTLGA